MLTAEARSRLTVVLVGARNPQNIGAAARAMQDFGFRDLRVVNEFAPPFEAARLEASSAVGAGEVMHSARLFHSLPEAIADCTVIAGTTAIGERGLRLPTYSLRDAASRLLSHLCLPPTASSRPETLSERDELMATGGEIPGFAPAPLSTAHSALLEPTRVALLFGSEKTGLTNGQLSHCSLLLTIPLFSPVGRHLSMNLGQAVAVCLYELSREGLEGARELPVLNTTPATSGDRERLTQLLLELMAECGYSRRFPANARLEVVRGLASGLGRNREESATWMGLFKQVLNRITHGTQA